MLKPRAILLDESDQGNKLKILLNIQPAIQIAYGADNERSISHAVQFFKLYKDEVLLATKRAHDLDLRPATREDKEQIETLLDKAWLRDSELLERIHRFADEHITSQHSAHGLNGISLKRTLARELLKKRQKQLDQCLQEQQQHNKWLVDLELQEWRRQPEMQKRFEQIEQRRKSYLLQLHKQLTRREDLEELHQNLKTQENVLQGDQLTKQKEVEGLLQYLKTRENDLLGDQLTNLEWLQGQKQRSLGLLEQFELRGFELREHCDQLKQYLQDLEQKRWGFAKQTIIVDAVLIVPVGLLAGKNTTERNLNGRQLTAEIAMEAVMHAERDLGNYPVDVSEQNLGYDIESRDANGHLRFIEVKGRIINLPTVALSPNEIRTARKYRTQYILAIVEVDIGKPQEPRYLYAYDFREPDPLAHSVHFKLKDLLELCEAPT